MKRTPTRQASHPIPKKGHRFLDAQWGQGYLYPRASWVLLDTPTSSAKPINSYLAPRFRVFTDTWNLHIWTESWLLDPGLPSLGALVTPGLEWDNGTKPLAPLWPRAHSAPQVLFASDLICSVSRKLKLTSGQNDRKTSLSGFPT